MTISEAFDQAENLAKQNPPGTIVLNAEMHLTLNIRHDFATSFSPYAAIAINGFTWQGITSSQVSFKTPLDTALSGGILGGDADPKPSSSPLRYIYPLTSVSVSLIRSVATFKGASPFSLGVTGTFSDRANNISHKISRSFFLNGNDTKTCKLAGFTKNTNPSKFGAPNFVEDDSIPYDQKSFLFLNIISVDVVPPPK